MLNKEIKFNKEARTSLEKGINIVANAVKVTLGPKGHCVIIGDRDKPLRVTKDGVSVAKEVQLADPLENAGAQLIKEAAIKTLNTVGDSTTTSTILAQSLINQSKAFLEQEDINAVKMQKGLKHAANIVSDYINHHTIPISDFGVKSIATISSNNDTTIGEMIANTFKQIGNDGVITVAESSNVDTTVDVVSGMRIDRGYLCQHFVTDFVKDNCVLENPYILITEEKITSIHSIKFILNQVAQEGRALLLIAEDFDESVLETLKLNKLQGILKICAIKAPSFGEYRKMILQDIAILTNGSCITYDSGLEVSDVTMAMLGKCKKVVVTKENTTFIGGEGSENIIQDRVKELKSELERTKEDATKDGSFMIKFLQERIARLTGGVAVIYVGGTTEIEMQERKDRIEDAVAATKAAIEGGVVFGGGLTYLNAAKILDLDAEDISYRAGFFILKNALIHPFKQILENAGYIDKDYEYIRNKVTELIGFDANKEEFVDMAEAGIVDPAKAAHLALENAVSIASLYMVTDCIIVPEPINQFIA